MKHQSIFSKSLLFFIIVLALALRLVGLNWDQGHHLHPDERYITMVASDIKWPVIETNSHPVINLYHSFKLYLSPQSPLSPYNYDNFKSFLYGTFPIFWVKGWAGALGWDDYAHLVWVGRFWSAIFSAISVILVFLLTKQIYKELSFVDQVSLLAAFFTAASVTLVQHAHFFTMESFLVTFSLLVIYFSYKILESGRLRNFVLAGVWLGFALACKVSALFLLGVVGLAVLGRVAKETAETREVREVLLSKRLVLLPIFSLVFLCAAYLSFRLLQPYAFASSSFLDFSIQPNFLAALKQQRAAMRGEFLYPPSFQWLLSMRFWSPFKNLVVWGLGPALGVSGVLGIFWMSFEMVIKRKFHFSLILSYILSLFFYVGGQFVHSMRYLITIVPLLGIAGAYFWAAVWAVVAPFPQKTARLVGYVGPVTAVVLSLLWALAFTTIYTRDTTRLVASRWVYQNVPSGAVLANEDWDDALPLALPTAARAWDSRAQRYEGLTLAVYNQDNSQKLADFYRGLSKTDFVILSSARASGSIGRLPGRFPIMSKYYHYLNTGQLGFQKAVEVASFPQLFGIIINDQGAEETFWVYDHPVVKIYRKTRDLDWGEFQNLFN